MREVLKKFGRYFLLDQIAQGGMAEIYRARLASPDGAGRLLVIKRIQAGFGSNNEFLQMFKSEIKVTMGFNHPNIVQLYDFGEEQNQPFISMELVDGKNLKQFISRCTERKETLPIDIAAYIIEQACSALQYAHTFKDKITGAPLNIVHRDISPQNVIIAFEGSVKVIDFGIAKATTNVESTRAGIIKGKPSYLSPEQISGETLDGRCDIFALGAVFWELLTGKKLFSGENDLAVLKQIESCQTSVKPPSTLNSQVPPELNYIVLKALAKQRDKRYQTAEELQRAIHKFIYAYSPDFDPADLSYYAKNLFKDEIVEDRKRIQKLNDKVEQLLSAEFVHEGNTALQEVKAEKPTPDLDGTTTMPTPRNLGSQPQEQANQTSHIQNEQAVDPRFKLKERVNPRDRFNSTNTHRSIPKQKIKPIEYSSGSGFGRIALGAACVGIFVLFFGKDLGLTLPSLTSPVSTIREPSSIPTGGSSAHSEGNAGEGKTTPNSVMPGYVTLRLNVTPAGGRPYLTVNGKAINIDNPLIKVPLDSPLELVADRSGYKPLRREFTIDSKQVAGAKEWKMDVPLEPAKFGFLNIRTTPSADVTIMMDGRPWSKRTPLENEKFPVGVYTLKLTNEIVGMEKSITVSIQEGKVINVDEKLEIKN